MNSNSGTGVRVQAVVASFGYGHGPAPLADVTVDVRRRLRNPHHNPAMRYLTGRDPVVREHVLATPGARGLIHHAVDTIHDLIRDTNGEPVVWAVGCVGGRHRSYVLAAEITAVLVDLGIAAVVEHRDIDRDVLPTTTHQQRAEGARS
ncbi:ATPase [Saccharopolyspora sp. K220]|uniref:RapZ C-terminal domain-containing protein n=1 Tax=Saccharopolyspora soli TaxID=2926618 RepID=UPI001F563ADE|nr:RNase adapter RapZ [Saccharopolyspora soli]MCI2423971.1 ATPase [Saccharopolyspora soli]